MALFFFKSISYLANSELESLFQCRDGLINVLDTSCITSRLLRVLTRVTPIKSEGFFLLIKTLLTTTE